MTYDQFVSLAKCLPDVVEEGFNVSRGKGWMFSLKPDGSLVIKLDWEAHNALLAGDPETFYRTPHYEGYPALLVRLENLNKTLAAEILKSSWTFAPVKPKSPRSRGKL